MVDNSWIDSDRTNVGQTKAIHLKVYISIAILIISGIGVVALHGVGSNATLYQAEGILVDYGDYRTFWTDIKQTESTDPVEMLDMACKKQNLEYVMDPSTTVLTMVQFKAYEGAPAEDIANTDTHTWELWTVDSSGKATKSPDHKISTRDYKCVIWAYTQIDGGEPATVVDATNTCIYGYSMPDRVVTLSPVSTEIVWSVGAINTIVGTDSYSDYPAAIKERRDQNLIATVGTYLAPSYESIMHTSPDLVVCDSSAGQHIVMAEKVRSSDVNAIVLYDAVDMDSIFTNIFIASAAMGWNTAHDLIEKMKDAMAEIDAKVEGHATTTAMFPLGADRAPYVQAANTYFGDIAEEVNAVNVFDDMSGWPLITPEYISQRNPQMIMVIDGGSYHPDEYDQMIQNLKGSTWQDTDAYKNGNIYLLADDMGSMAQRAGPRFVYLYELSARILNPDCFDDDQQKMLNKTKAIGSNFMDYLSYTSGVLPT